MPGRYASIGLALIGFGAPLSLTGHFVLGDVSVTALGLSSVILGLTAANLPEEVVPPVSVRSMLRSSALNVEALLEEFEPVKAVYAPRGDVVAAYLPLEDKPGLDLDALDDAPRRLLTSVDGEPALMVFPPGSELPRSSEVDSLEGVLRELLVERSELCSSVRASTVGDLVVVEVGGVKASAEAPRLEELMGGLHGCVAACATASQMGGKVEFLDERTEDGKSVLRFQVVG